MSEDYYLIDSQLGVKPINAYLSNKGTWWDKGLLDAKLAAGDIVGAGASSGLPLTTDGALRPGVLYESSADSHVRFYLPEYRLRVVDGRYTTRLKWRDEHADPNGPLAFLTVEVMAVVPANGGFSLQEIPHQAVARIGYQMSIQDSGSQAPATPFAAFLGTWINVDPNTSSMTRLEILPLNHEAVTFHGFGKCHPQDCDWGTTRAQLVGDALVGTYDFGFKQTTITVQLHGNQLVCEEFNHFAPGDSRPDRTDHDILSGGKPDAGSGTDRPVLWIDVGALNSVGGGVRSVTLPISDKRDFDRLYQVMTDSNLMSRLEIRYFATAGRRTWRQIVLGNVSLKAQMLALQNKHVIYTNMVAEKNLEIPVDVTKHGINIRTTQLGDVATKPLSFQEAVKLTDTPVVALVKAEQPLGLSPALADRVLTNTTSVKTIHPRLFEVASAHPAVMSALLKANVDAPLSPHLTPHDVSAIPAHPVVNATPLNGPLLNDLVLHEMVVQPVLARAYARPLPEILQNSDVVTKVGPATQKAVPVKAIIGEDGQPALIEIAVETRQDINPFWFPVATNAYMFDIPGDVQPGTHHILIRLEVRDGSGQVAGVFYQDSAYTDQFYYQPQEFRLPRLNTPPYLPELRIVFFDLVTQDGSGGDNQAIFNYKVQLAYRVLPYINPQVLDLAQQQVPNVQAHFNALEPQISSLSLRVPEDETGGALTDVARPSVNIRFDQGIVDQIELTRTEFERIFAFFQSPAGVGIEGVVQAALLGNLTANVPVRLSLKENTGTVFGHTYLGPQGDGIHRVRLVNRIESPVTIDSLFRIALGGGMFAFPQAAPGQVVQPGQQLDLDYRVDPPAAAVADIDPLLLVSINADPSQLWPQLFINQGYTSETFQLHLAIEPDFFGVAPPGGGDPLSGVLVEFDDSTTTTLTAARLQADVHLRIPLLPRLMNDPQAKRYQYRITNLLGADAHAGQKSDLITGMGDAPLTITPAGV